MFCEKCGTRLPETADFCPKCGHEFENSNNNIIKNNDNSNEILLEIRPTFKFSYVVLPKLLKELIYIVPCIFIAIYFISSVSRISSSMDGGSSSISFTAFLPIIFMLIGIPLIRMLFVIGKSFIDKKQYENYVYTFYPNRVVFKDSFLNVSEKELKYKHIREITKRQTFIQRYFNIGNIVMFSNAESGFLSGIFMINIEDVDNVYHKVKEITNI